MSINLSGTTLSRITSKSVWVSLLFIVVMIFFSMVWFPLGFTLCKTDSKPPVMNATSSDMVTHPVMLGRELSLLREKVISLEQDVAELKRTRWQLPVLVNDHSPNKD